MKNKTYNEYNITVFLGNIPTPTKYQDTSPKIITILRRHQRIQMEQSFLYEDDKS